MRNDVIHIRGLYELPLLETFLTVGMLQDEASTKRLPPASVATLRRGPSHLATTHLAGGLRLGFEFGVAFGAGLRMEVAVALASRDGPVASGVSTES